MTSSAHPDDADRRQWISDLVDGRLSGEELEQACNRWSGDPAFRQTWLSYHLIGDALRSDDLAQLPADSDGFMSDLRERLAREPAVLAPTPTSTRRKAWQLPIAAAACVIAVVGSLVVLRNPTPGASPVLAVRSAVNSDAPVEVLRDARIDDYLRAHRETLAGSPAALPGGAMRNVDFDLPPR